MGCINRCGSELKGHTNVVFSVAFSSDGTLIVSGSADRSVRVWDVLIGVELKELKGHTNWVSSVAFSSNGCYDFKRFRQSSTVVGSKVQCQMSLEECKSWTCIVLLGLRAKFK